MPDNLALGKAHLTPACCGHYNLPRERNTAGSCARPETRAQARKGLLDERSSSHGSDAPYGIAGKGLLAR